MTAITRYWAGPWRPVGDFSNKAVTIPSTGVEILYPIQPVPKSNVLVFSKDSREWEGLQKSATIWRHEFVTLRYRIRSGNIKGFIEALINGKGKKLQLSTPCMQPFIRTTTTNEVYLISWSNPVREKALHHIMSVTYLYHEKQDSP
jgi:hypothetical protein